MKYAVRLVNKDTQKFITQAFFPTLEASEKFANNMLKVAKEPAVARIYELKEDLVKTIDPSIDVAEEAGKDQKK